MRADAANPAGAEISVSGSGLVPEPAEQTGKHAAELFSAEHAELADGSHVRIRLTLNAEIELPDLTRELA